MKIAIIGIGNVGTALACNWAAKGHRIFFGVSDPKNPKVKTVLDSVPNSRADRNREAASDAEVVVLAVPFDAVRSVLSECGDLTARSFSTAPIRWRLTFGASLSDSPPRAASRWHRWPAMPACSRLSIRPASAIWPTPHFLEADR